MTFEKLKKAIDKNNIPYNVHLQSDSGWECSETEMDGVYYSREKNLIVFTQHVSRYEYYDPRYESSFGKREEFSGFIPIAGLDVWYEDGKRKTKKII